MNFKKIIFSICLFCCVSGLYAQYNNSATTQMGWQLAAQAWTFKLFAFDVALDKMKAAGITNIEMYPGQTIGANITGDTNYKLDKEKRKELLSLIQSKGMKLLNYGVVNLKTTAEWDQLFDFAKDMGIKTIITEADSTLLNYIEPLALKYQINIALHNHAKPSIYWNPDFTMNQISKRNKYIGVCTDLGHWIRSGLDALESLKKYEGRILAVHAKDLIPGVEGKLGYHDVPWGTGISDFSGLMHELKRQGYKGSITVEYEHHWDNSLPEVKESVEYFNRLTSWMIKE